MSAQYDVTIEIGDSQHEVTVNADSDIQAEELALDEICNRMEVIEVIRQRRGSDW